MVALVPGLDPLLSVESTLLDTIDPNQALMCFLMFLLVRWALEDGALVRPEVLVAAIVYIDLALLLCIRMEQTKVSFTLVPFKLPVHPLVVVILVYITSWDFACFFLEVLVAAMVGIVLASPTFFSVVVAVFRTETLDPAELLVLLLIDFFCRFR